MVISENLLGRCKYHQTLPAVWECDACHNYFCDRCIDIRNFGTVRAKVCQLCRGRCMAITLDEPGVQPNSFFEQLPKAFSYPFKGGGKVMLIMGGLFLWVLDFLTSLSFYAFFLVLFAAGYLSAYMIKIVNRSASGEEELPHWPEPDLVDTILRSFFLVAGSLVVSFSPALIYHFLFSPQEWTADPLIWILIGLGLLYWPMGLIAVTLFNTVSALRPDFVVRSILRIPRDYLAAGGVILLFFCMITEGKRVLTISLPFIGPFLDYLLALISVRLSDSVFAITS